MERKFVPAHSNRLRAVFDGFLLLFYLAFIYWLSAHPKLPAPIFFSWQDKLYHAGAYFLMGLFAWRCFRYFSVDFRTQLLISLAFCSVYGITDEWHQYFVPGRSSSVGDWVADTVGAVLAVIAIQDGVNKLHRELGSEAEEEQKE